MAEGIPFHTAPPPGRAGLRRGRQVKQGSPLSLASTVPPSSSSSPSASPEVGSAARTHESGSHPSPRKFTRRHSYSLGAARASPSAAARSRPPVYARRSGDPSEDALLAAEEIDSDDDGGGVGDAEDGELDGEEDGFYEDDDAFESDPHHRFLRSSTDRYAHGAASFGRPQQPHASQPASAASSAEPRRGLRRIYSSDSLLTLGDVDPPAEAPSGTPGSRAQERRRDLFFVVFGAQLAAVLFVGTMYLNWLVFLPYAVPFLLAVALSIALRGVKDLVIEFLRPLRAAARSQTKPWLPGRFRIFLLELRVMARPQAFFAFLSLYALFAACCGYLVFASFLYSNSTYAAYAGCVLLLWPIGLIIAFPGAHHTVVALSMVIVLLTALVGMGHLVVHHVVSENTLIVDASMAGLNRALERWFNTSVTPEAVTSVLKSGLNVTTVWAKERGYDVDALVTIAATLRQQYEDRNATEFDAAYEPSAGVADGSDSGEFFGTMNGMMVGSVVNIFQKYYEEMYGAAVYVHQTGLVGGFLDLGRNSFGLTLQAFKQLLGMVALLGSFMYSFTSSALVFVWSLFVLLRTEHQLFPWLALDLLPFPNEMKFSMRETVELTVQRVFFRAVVMFSVHMMATLALFTLLDLRFALAASAAAGFFAIFPYVSGLIMFAPVLVALVSFSYPLYAYLYFAVVLVIVFYVLDPFVDELFPMEYPQITALSAVLGIYAFGFSGFILGPVLVSMVASFIATYQWYEKLAKQVADGASGLPTRDVSMSSSVLSKSTQMAQFQAGGLFGSVWGMFAVLSVVFIIIPITVRVSA